MKKSEDIDNDYCITHKLWHGKAHPDCKTKGELWLRHTETAEELIRRAHEKMKQIIIEKMEECRNWNGPKIDDVIEFIERIDFCKVEKMTNKSFKEQITEIVRLLERGLTPVVSHDYLNSEEAIDAILAAHQQAISAISNDK